MSEFRDLPYGPWKDIFTGIWSGYPVKILENQDKQILTLIFDKKDDKIEGLVLIMCNFYYSEDHLENLQFSYPGDSIILEKKYLGNITKFFGVSTDPVYVKYEMSRIVNKVSELHDELEYKKQKIYELSESNNIRIFDLKNKKELASKLFTEPIIFAAMISHIKGEELNIEKPMKETVFLGFKITGEKVEEPVDLFKSIVCIGEKLDIQRFHHVLVEELVLCGLNVIVWDEEGKYLNIGSAADYVDENSGLDPMGLPYKILEPQKDVFIDLNTLDGDLFLEMFNLPKNPVNDKYTMILLRESIENTSKIKNLKDLIDYLENNVKDEKLLYFKNRAIRILKLMDKKYPKLFLGDSQILENIEKKLVHIGKVLLIKLDDKNYSLNIKKGLFYSLFKNMYDFYKERGNPEIQTFFILDNGKDFFEVNSESKFVKENINLLDSYTYGLGYSLGSESELDFDPKVIDVCELKVIHVSDRDYAIRFKVKKPYRIKLRYPVSEGV